MEFEYISLGAGEPFITCGLINDVAYPSPEQLDVSPEMRDSLQDWIDRFGVAGEGEGGVGTFNHDYLAEGWNLARRLARELGPRPVVYWASVPALDAPHP